MSDAWAVGTMPFSIARAAIKMTASAGRIYGEELRKICAASVAELQLAAEREGRLDGSFSKRCGFCRP